MFGFLKKIFGTAQDRLIKKYFKVVTKVNAFDEQYKSLSDDALRNKTAEFRSRLEKGETLDDLLPEAYAVVKNTCRRLGGTEIHVSGYDQKWDMIPYDVQIVGAIAMHHGAIAEMMTGEGKTLTASMPLYLNALSKDPVHLVTVNDYLAQRDCQWVGTIFRWLGLTTAALTNDVPTENRKALYQADIVYGTASEFGFDYLRDNSMASRQDDQVQRGYFFAIIDEVDSILIDEARTPLIISGPVPVSRQMYDELKLQVSEIVRLQREFCNRLAMDAKKELEKIQTLDGQKKDKKQLEIEQEAFRKLWLVGKGTPRNKVVKRFKEDPDMRAALDNMDLYYYADQNKDERLKLLAELYMIVDEKNSEFELTDKGVALWQEMGDGKGDEFVMLDIGHEYFLIDENEELSEDKKVEKKLAIQEEDAKRKERSHNLRQLLRAHLLMEKDVDYIIQEEKIVIIDENTGRTQPGRRFSDGLHQAIEAKEGDEGKIKLVDEQTGRIMDGRRYSDGLHQAIEAKENVKVEDATQTYATITLQNYFRMYKKLAGMTGTATTEANELKSIYKIDVLEIPTHRICKRMDVNDQIYMTEREKYNAILKEVREIHETGRPILIGTESVDISEKLSRIFRQNKLEHTVLNAKQNEKEAEIIAHAGRRNAITVSTNMAGRGTDIKLEQGIAEIGGLAVIGTTRHESRRIDRQLRGRSARQGDPGSSKFFVSFDDRLLRLFASPRLTGILQKFRPPEGEPISAGILNKSIETAQKRIEQRNYTVRKHTLEYDDVMNKQRQEIYAFRNEVLHSKNVEPLAVELLQTVCGSAADQYFRSRSEDGGWDPEGYREWLMRHFPVTFPEGFFDNDHSDIEELEHMASEKIIHAFEDKLNRESAKIGSTPDSGIKPTNEAVRNLIVRKIDGLWQEHLLKMDHLRTDVNLRTVGQRDPLTEFKHEAFNLFDEFSRTLRTEIAQDLFRFEIMRRPPQSIQQILNQLQMETNRSFAAELDAET